MKCKQDGEQGRLCRTDPRQVGLNYGKSKPMVVHPVRTLKLGAHKQDKQDRQDKVHNESIIQA